MICVKNTEANDRDARNIQVNVGEHEILDDLISILKLFSERADLRRLLRAALILSEVKIETLPKESNANVESEKRS